MIKTVTIWYDNQSRGFGYAAWTGEPARPGTYDHGDMLPEAGLLKDAVAAVKEMFPGAEVIVVGAA